MYDRITEVFKKNFLARFQLTKTKDINTANILLDFLHQNNITKKKEYLIRRKKKI